MTMVEYQFDIKTTYVGARFIFISGIFMLEISASIVHQPGLPICNDSDKRKIELPNAFVFLVKKLQKYI